MRKIEKWLWGFICKASILIAVSITYSACPAQAATQYRDDSLRSGNSDYVATYAPYKEWQYSSGTTCSASPIISQNGTVYFGGYDRYFRAVSSSGSLLWKSTKYSSSIISSAAVGNNGVIYFSTLGGTICALGANGDSQWANPCTLAGGNVGGAILLGNDGTLYVGADNSRVYAINPDGTIKWSSITGGAIKRSLSMSQDGSTIYAPSEDGRLYAIGSDGSILWKTNIINPSNNCAVGADGTLYVGTTSGTLVAIGSDGSIKWTYATQSKTISTSPAIGADGTIYFGGQDTCLHAVNPDGTVKWLYRTSASIYSSPTIDAAGIILFGTYSGSLVALNPDGSLNWSRNIGSTIYTSPTIGSDGSIYVIDSLGQLTKYTGPVNAPAETPEPSTMVCLLGAIAAILAKYKRRQR